MLMKGIGLILLILMVVAVKSDHTTRAFIFVLVAGGLLYIGMNKGRR